MNVLDEFKNYKRKFIQISPRTAILLHIFSKDSDDFEDIVLLDNEGYRENRILQNIIICYKNIKQLMITLF